MSIKLNIILKGAGEVSDFRGHSRPCDVGKRPGTNERYGSSGATIVDGYIFGRRWATMKHSQSLQKYVVITRDFTGEIVVWEYFARKNHAENERDYYRSAGFNSQVHKCAK